MKSSTISRHWPAEAECDIDALLQGAIPMDASSSIRKAILDLERLKTQADLSSEAFVKVAEAIRLLRDAEQDQVHRAS